VGWPSKARHGGRPLDYETELAQQSQLGEQVLGSLGFGVTASSNDGDMMMLEMEEATRAAHRLITEAPDAMGLALVAEKHWRSFDATATVRTVAWLAKFSTLPSQADIDDQQADVMTSLGEDNVALVRLKSLVSKFSSTFSTRDVVVLLSAFAQLGLSLTPALADRARTLTEANLATLSSQEVVCTVWALGRVKAKASKRLLRSLEDRCLSCSSAMKINELVQMFWGFGQLSHKVTKKWYQNLKEHSHLQHFKDLQPSEQALFAWSLSTVGLWEDKLVTKTLLEMFRSSIRQYDLISMNLVLKCFHRMKIKVPSDLLTKCEVRCLQCMSKCPTGPITDFIYRCVKSRHTVNVHTRVHVENLVFSKMEDLSSKDMALLMWSFAKVGHKPKQRFLKKMENHFEVLSVKPQSLSLLIWAYAKLRLPVSTRFSKAHYYMVGEALSEMNMQCLSNVMWSYGRLGMDVPKDLFAELTNHLKLNLKVCNSQHISNIMVSCARLGMRPDDELLSMIELVSMQKLSTFSCQGMSNMLWSFVKLNWKPKEEFMLSFQKHFGASVQKSSPQNHANVLWSFAQMHYMPYDSVMESLFESVELKLDTFKEHDIATILWACGKLKYRMSPVLLKKFHAYCLKRSTQFSLHDISLSLWGFTQQSLDLRPELIQAMYERTMTHLDKEFHPEAFVHVVWALSVRDTEGLNRGALLVEKYEEEVLRRVQDLSGYDASKLYCSMSFMGVLTERPRICNKLQSVIENRINSYDEGQLQSIINAYEALDLLDLEFRSKLDKALNK
jgi:hypothetical protein